MKQSVNPVSVIFRERERGTRWERGKGKNTQLSREEKSLGRAVCQDSPTSYLVERQRGVQCGSRESRIPTGRVSCIPDCSPPLRVKFSSRFLFRHLSLSLSRGFAFRRASRRSAAVCNCAPCQPEDYAVPKDYTDFGAKELVPLRTNRVPHPRAESESHQPLTMLLPRSIRPPSPFVASRVCIAFALRRLPPIIPLCVPLPWRVLRQSSSLETRTKQWVYRNSTSLCRVSLLSRIFLSFFFFFFSKHPTPKEIINQGTRVNGILE